MVDIFQGRTVLLSLSELSGPGLESCVFATYDSPGLLVLFWDLSDTVLHRAQFLCPLLGNERCWNSLLLLCCCYTAFVAALLATLLVKTLPPGSHDECHLHHARTKG